MRIQTRNNKLCMRYTGSTRTVLPDVAALKPTGAMSASAWVKWNGLNGATQGVLSCQSGTTAVYRLQSVNSIYFSYAHQDGASTYTLISSVPMPIGTWVHLAFTRDASYNTIIYMNGMLVASGSTAIVPTDPGIAPVIGAVNSGFAYFNGFIDDVRMYDRVLTEDEVKALAKDEPISRDNLLAEYLFEDGVIGGSGNPVDTSGNGQDATANTGTFQIAQRNETRVQVRDSRGSAAYNGSTTTATITTGTIYTKILGASGITVGGWYYVKRFLGATSYMDGVVTSSGGSGTMIYLSNTNTINVASRSVAADGGSVTAGFTPTLGTWYHLVGVSDYANALVKLYINGKLFSEVAGTFAQTTYAGGDNTYGIASSGGGTGFADICVKDSVMYSRALSDDEIYNLSKNIISRTNLVRHLPCNDGYSLTLTDVSGNGYNYTNNSAVAFSLNSPY